MGWPLARRAQARHLAIRGGDAALVRRTSNWAGTFLRSLAAQCREFGALPVIELLRRWVTVAAVRGGTIAGHSGQQLRHALSVREHMLNPSEFREATVCGDDD